MLSEKVTDMMVEQDILDAEWDDCTSKSRCKKCGYESIFFQWNGYIAGGDSHCINCGAYRSFEDMSKEVKHD